MKRSLNCLFAAIFAVVLATTGAAATTFNFEGKITSANTACNDSHDWDTSTIISGVIQFDSAVAGTAIGSGMKYDFGPPPEGRISGKIGPDNFDFDTGFYIQVINDNPDGEDQLRIYAEKRNPPGTPQGDKRNEYTLDIALIDVQGTAMSGHGLPRTSIELAPYQDHADDQNFGKFLILQPAGCEFVAEYTVTQMLRQGPSFTVIIGGVVVVLVGIVVAFTVARRMRSPVSAT